MPLMHQLDHKNLLDTFREAERQLNQLHQLRDDLRIKGQRAFVHLQNSLTGPVEFPVDSIISIIDRRIRTGEEVLASITSHIAAVDRLLADRQADES